jgi:hypothetical protein
VALKAVPLQDQVKAVDALPPGVGTLSSIAIGAYKRDGGGAKIMSKYLARLFLFAAVMYIDNTDLLHWADAPEDKNEELIENF